MPETQRQKVGKIGEDIVAGLLKNKGYSVLDRNYRKKWGELDIVVQKDKVIHFIEVKTLKHDLLKEQSEYQRPEENVHEKKLKRLSRIIQTYLLHKKMEQNHTWQIDLAIVLVDIYNKKARVRFINNVIIGG
jgi:putative endonuclease